MNNITELLFYSRRQLFESRSGGGGVFGSDGGCESSSRIKVM